MYRFTSIIFKVNNFIKLFFHAHKNTLFLVLKIVYLVKVCTVVSPKDYQYTLAPFATSWVISMHVTLYQTIPSPALGAFVARHSLTFANQEVMELTECIIESVALIVA